MGGWAVGCWSRANAGGGGWIVMGIRLITDFIRRRGKPRIRTCEMVLIQELSPLGTIGGMKAS